MPQLWLVEREYDDRNLISFVYATTDGTHQLRKELSATLLQQRSEPVTAAIEKTSLRRSIPTNRSGMRRKPSRSPRTTSRMSRFSRR